MLETYQPQARIVFTSANSRRISAWSHMEPHHPPISIVPLDEEPSIRETNHIAQGKITSVAKHHESLPHDHYVSADALVYAGNQPMRKPEELAQLQKNFEKVAQHGGVYDIRSHTVLGTAASETDRSLHFTEFPLGTRIQLHPDKAAWLATPEGTQAYLATLDLLYDSQVTYKKIASGICVMTLVAMGAVESLEGEKISPQEEQASLEAIYSAAYTAIINVSPQALFALAQKAHGVDQSTQEEYWNKLEHHPYLEEIVSKVWKMYGEQTLR